MNTIVKTISGLATLAMTLIAVSAAAPAVSADTGGLVLQPSDGTTSVVSYVRNVHSGKCLTVHGGSKADNARVDQYTCVGAANQRWSFEWTGGLTYNLRNINSGKCLTVHGGGTANGAVIDQYTCVGQANQSFAVNISKPTNTQLLIMSSRKCVDVQGASQANNAPVIQWSCNGGHNQSWNYS